MFAHERNGGDFGKAFRDCGRLGSRVMRAKACGASAAGSLRASEAIASGVSTRPKRSSIRRTTLTCASWSGVAKKMQFTRAPWCAATRRTSLRDARVTYVLSSTKRLAPSASLSVQTLCDAAESPSFGISVEPVRNRAQRRLPPRTTSRCWCYAHHHDDLGVAPRRDRAGGARRPDRGSAHRS